MQKVKYKIKNTAEISSMLAKLIWWLNFQP